MQSPSLPGKPLLPGSRVLEIILSLERPSRQAPLAGVLMLRLGRPGKLLLPGPCLLGLASSSCRGPCLECFVLEWLVSSWPRRAVEALGAPMASLAAAVLQLPVHKSGVLRYP